MTRARMRVVLAAVIACSPALLGASLAGAHPSDPSAHNIVSPQTIHAVAASDQAPHHEKGKAHGKKPASIMSDTVKVASQQVSAQVVRAHQEAKKAEEAAKRKKAAEERKAQQAAHRKAQEAARRKAVASRSHHRTCHPPGQIVDLSPSQTANAEAIVRAGHKLHISKKGQVIALSTALQESGLKNYANANVPASMGFKHQAVGYDHDSVGLFQQRPLPPWGAGSWGTPKQLMTPELSAMKFYNALRGIPGWHHLPVTVAAQRVQVSAFPSAYADDEPHAWSIVSALPCV